MRVPLTPREQARAYYWQLWVAAWKVCQRCQKRRPVAFFDGYRAQPCSVCLLEQAG